jgi:hypothetical protein
MVDSLIAIYSIGLLIQIIISMWLGMDGEVPNKQTAITELINKTLNPSPEDKNNYQ